MFLSFLQNLKILHTRTEKITSVCSHQERIRRVFQPVNLSQAVDVTNTSQDNNRNGWKNWEQHLKGDILYCTDYMINSKNTESRPFSTLTKANHVPDKGFRGGAKNHVDQPESVEDFDAHPGK